MIEEDRQYLGAKSYYAEAAAPCGTSALSGEQQPSQQYFEGIGFTLQLLSLFHRLNKDTLKFRLEYRAASYSVSS